MTVAQPDPALMLPRRAALDIALDSLGSSMERLLLRVGAMVASNPALALQAAAVPHVHPARFERLFVDHYRFVWRTLRRLGVQEAAVDDAAQQVFIVANRRLAEVSVEKERSFLIGVAVRVASNARRTQTRRREDADSDAVAEQTAPSDPEDLLVWKQRRQKLDEWLQALSLELRAPFVLFELEGLSLLEISEVLELPLGTVKTRLRKARAIFLEAAAVGGAA